jgi:hypothetical protein
VHCFAALAMTIRSITALYCHYGERKHRGILITRAAKISFENKIPVS